MEEVKNVVANENFDWNAFENDLGVYDQDKAQITEAYDKTLSNVNVGEVVEGTVTGVNKREVIVNVGYKSEGIIPVSEFRYNPDLKVGDKIEVYVESAEDKNGQLALSHKKARQLKSWDRVNEALEKDEIIKGYIKCRTKGGMIVDVFGIEAFLPGSQIDVKPIRDYDVYVDKTMEFKVVKINQEFRNVVVSHKALIEAELEAQKQVIMSKLEKGQILEGTVKNITSYGVFVDLGGVDGLIHITDLSWGRVNHPEEIVALDQKINVVILDFDEAKKRIALGLKQLTPHPWEALDQTLKVGDKVKGRVVVMADYGAFVEIAPGVEGLIHVSEMSWSQHLRSAQEFMKVGDEVEAVILTLDREERKMSLGIKQLTPDPWENIEVKYPVGTKTTAKVRNFTNFGVFVEIEEGIDGLIHISDLSWTKKVKHPGEFTSVGADIEVVVLEIDKEIAQKVDEAMDKNQRDYYLHEQLHMISEELGEDDDTTAEAEEYRRKITALHLDEDREKKLLKEVDRLSKMQSSNQEGTVIRTYLDTCLDLPWNTMTVDDLDIHRAQQILDRDHYGLKKVKDRILETLAVRKLAPDVKAQIICLVGPPGVGKTSIARSIAESLGRKYVRISLGGVRDEAEIRGHRRTYIGAMPGKIISAMITAKSSNPLMLLDEIDKLAGDFRGDPAAALLEALDPEQNSTFNDHFIDIPFDLSHVLFITTANDLSAIYAIYPDVQDMWTYWLSKNPKMK